LIFAYSCLLLITIKLAIDANFLIVGFEAKFSFTVSIILWTCLLLIRANFSKQISKEKYENAKMLGKLIAFQEFSAMIFLFKFFGKNLIFVFLSFLVLYYIVFYFYFLPEKKKTEAMLDGSI